MAERPTTIMIHSGLRGGSKALLATLALAAFAAAPALAAAPARAPAPAPVAFALSSVGHTDSIVLHGRPGHVLGGAVLVRNISRHKITVVLQRADIGNSSNGNADYVTSRVAGVGHWLRLGAVRINLAPRTARQVAYTVSIPKLTTGASHYGGIVAFNAADLNHAAGHSKSKKRGFTFYQISRQALPLTIRMPGPLTRGLSLRSVKLAVQPSGAGLVLGLLPRGTVLTQGAQVKLRALRGKRTILTSSTALGQLFPGGALNYRIAWPGRPTPGSYRVVGTIRPQGSRVIYINTTVKFTAAAAKQLKRLTPASALIQPASGMPGWLWIALAAAVLLLIALPVGVWKLARRTAKVPA